MDDRMEFRFYGGVSVTAPDGTVLTPRGAKATGILYLLCEAHDMRRGRRFLQDKLWSDRGPTQAKASLRQALTEVRDAFARWSDLLGANRTEVWLDATRVRTDLTSDGLPRPPGRELLEALDVRDEAFDLWVRDRRLRSSETEPPTSPHILRSSELTIRAVPSEGGSAAERIVGRIIADQTARALEERLTGRRFATPGSGPRRGETDLEVRCDAAQDGASAVVFLRIEEGRGGRVLFSEHRRVSGSASDAISAEVIAGLVHSASARIVHALPLHLDLSRPEAAALGYSSLGLRRLARFDAEGFEEAQAHFARAHEANAGGIYLAWRAFARMAQLVEGAEGDTAAWREEVDELVPRALEQAGDNSLVVALSSLTRIMLEDDLAGPAELARRAMRWDQNSLFARQTLAVAHSAVGDSRQAYALSSACRRAAAADGLGHLWDLYHALVCISAGRLDEARAASERAAAAAPSFVAPRRQLVALCANAGDVTAARAHLAALKQLEPAFTLDRYLNDPRYPVLTLRNAGLLGPTRSKLDED